jgi:hypothetical protein
MAVPRPVLLALLGLALCAAAFLSTRGARDSGGAVTAAPAPAPVAPSTEAAKPAVQTDKQKAAPADTAKPAAPADPAKAQSPAIGQQINIAAKSAVVTEALDSGDAVVFFFSRPGPADDTGTRGAVNALRGEDRVTVISAGLNELSAFRPVLSGAGVSQVPAVVVAHAGKPARLLQGYVDGGTLRQTVADALR